MYFASIENQPLIVTLLYSLVAVILGSGAIIFFVAKFQEGKREGKKELGEDVQETIVNLTELAESQRKRIADQDVINESNAREIEALKQHIGRLEHKIDELQTIPLKQIADALAKQAEVINYFYENRDEFKAPKVEVKVGQGGANSAAKA